MDPISIESYLARLPDTERVIELNHHKNETLTSKKIGYTKLARRYLNVAAKTLSIVSLVLVIANFTFFTFKALRSFTVAKAFNIGISNLRKQNFSLKSISIQQDNKFTKTLAKAFPILNSATMFVISSAVGIATISTHIAIYLLDKYIEKKEMAIEKQEAFYKGSHSLQEMDTRLTTDNLRVEDVVRYKLLPENTTTREYALFLITMKDFRTISDPIERLNVSAIYNALTQKGAA